MPSTSRSIATVCRTQGVLGAVISRSILQCSHLQKEMFHETRMAVGINDFPHSIATIAPHGLPLFVVGAYRIVDAPRPYGGIIRASEDECWNEQAAARCVVNC